MDRLLREMKRRAVDLGHGRKPPLFEQADDVASTLPRNKMAFLVKAHE